MLHRLVQLIIKFQVVQKQLRIAVISSIPRLDVEGRSIGVSTCFPSSVQRVAVNNSTNAITTPIAAGII